MAKSYRARRKNAEKEAQKKAENKARKQQEEEQRKQEQQEEQQQSQEDQQSTQPANFGREPLQGDDSNKQEKKLSDYSPEELEKLSPGYRRHLENNAEKEKEDQAKAERLAKRVQEGKSKPNSPGTTPKGTPYTNPYERTPEQKRDYYNRHNHSDPSQSKARKKQERKNANNEKRASKAVKTASNEAGVSAGNAKKAVTVATNLPLVITIVIVILIIILAIGIILFFQNMPSQVIGQIKKTANSIGAFLISKVNGNQTDITEDEVIDLAQYLENMGYNVEGYGFADVQYSESDEDLGNTYGANTTSGKAKKIKSITKNSKSKNYLRDYMAADQSTYFKATDNFLGYFSAAFDDLDNLINSSDSATIAANSKDYSTGMIEVNDVQNQASNFLIELIALRGKGSTSIDKNTHALTIKGQNNYNYSFSMDGWTSKYGRPLELFLALHLSTMMPDLTDQIATSDAFNTKVHISFQETALYASNMIVQTSDGTQINKSDVMRAYANYLVSLFDDAKNNYSSASSQTTADSTYSDYAQTDEACKTYLKGIIDNNDTEAIEKVVVGVKNDIGSNDSLASYICKNYLTSQTFEGIPSEPKNTDLSGNEASKISGLTKTQLNELTELYADLAKGKAFYLPFITRVSKHWFWDGNKSSEDGTAQDSNNNVYFTGSDNQYTGVYQKTTSAKKWVTFTPNGSSSLQGFQIQIDGLISDDNGFWYQVNEPYIVGPNKELIALFKEKYYKYDGTEETARKIAAAKAIDENKDSYYFHGEKTSVTDDDKTDYDNGQLATKETPSFGTTRDTLSGFEILKNMDTEDSETIYRMLKQLATSEKLAEAIGEENTLNADDITEDLKHILIWPFDKDLDESPTAPGTTSKDKNEYGLVISDVNGKDFLAPIDCEVRKVEGTTVTLKLGSLSDEAVNALTMKYKDDFYNIKKDLLNGWTMVIEGVSGAQAKQYSRGEKIGTATDKVTIVLQRINKTIVGGESDTVEDNIEDYMDNTYTLTDEKALKEHGIADENAPIIDESGYGLKDESGTNKDTTDYSNGVYANGDLTFVTDTSISWEDFDNAVQNCPKGYLGNHANDFKENDKVLYDYCINEGINPVFMACIAMKEQSWSAAHFRYWNLAKEGDLGKEYGFAAYSSMEKAIKDAVYNIKNQRLLATPSNDPFGIIKYSKKYSLADGIHFTGGVNNVYDLMIGYPGYDRQTVTNYVGGETGLFFWAKTIFKIDYTKKNGNQSPTPESNPDPDTNTGSAQFSWPTKTKIVTSKFTLARTLNGITRPHKGIDIAVVNAPVYAIADGTLYKYSDPSGYGQYVIIYHKNNQYASLYAHLSSVAVSNGTKVKKGEQIGISGGSTGNKNLDGNAQGAHLHFEIRYNKQGISVNDTSTFFGVATPQDPEKLLK